MAGIVKKLFGPRLVEHIPGEKRVYKNMFGKTTKTIERVEQIIENLEPDKVSKFMCKLNKIGMDPSVIYSIDKIAATRKPIDAVSFMVVDKNDYLIRANASLKSGEAKMRYKSSFDKYGLLDSAEAIVK